MTMFGPGNKAGRKLSTKEVEEIRVAYENGHSQGAIARHYRMSVVQIGRIVRGESWNVSGRLREAPARMAQPPTEAEREAVLEKLLQLQASRRVDSPPPSLLDGGDAPDETAGAGTTTLEDRARALGAELKK